MSQVHQNAVDGCRRFLETAAANGSKGCDHETVDKVFKALARVDVDAARKEVELSLLNDVLDKLPQRDETLVLLTQILEKAEFFKIWINGTIFYKFLHRTINQPDFPITSLLLLTTAFSKLSSTTDGSVIHQKKRTKTGAQTEQNILESMTRALSVLLRHIHSTRPSLSPYLDSLFVYSMCHLFSIYSHFFTYFNRSLKTNFLETLIMSSSSVHKSALLVSLCHTFPKKSASKLRDLSQSCLVELRNGLFGSDLPGHGRVSQNSTFRVAFESINGQPDFAFCFDTLREGIESEIESWVPVTCVMELVGLYLDDLIGMPHKFEDNMVWILSMLGCLRSLVRCSGEVLITCGKYLSEIITKLIDIVHIYDEKKIRLEVLRVFEEVYKTGYFVNPVLDEKVLACLVQNKAYSTIKVVIRSVGIYLSKEYRLSLHKSVLAVGHKPTLLELSLNPISGLSHDATLLPGLQHTNSAIYDLILNPPSTWVPTAVSTELHQTLHDLIHPPPSTTSQMATSPTVTSTKQADPSAMPESVNVGPDPKVVRDKDTAEKQGENSAAVDPDSDSDFEIPDIVI